ncbi:hypothetical protein [Photobacterium nomapromontoriensis]|uniref:hypothetical protein n=1 Tax=Photobacterium nomapromontoriensis TaxID=2910237 RepID=UPI003D0EE898
MKSKAYDEGANSVGVYSNPYSLNTAEFNDYERGWVQKIKSGPNHCFGSKPHKRLSMKDKYGPKRTLSYDFDSVDQTSGYAKAKSR